jgi:hypothetical protein
MSGAVAMFVVGLVIVGAVAWVLANMAKSIREERPSKRSRLWKNFGLSIGFCVLFFTTWAAQAVAQWQVMTDEAAEHGQTLATGDFFNQFAASTLENWQSEFLQLFAFVVMAAVLIHKGSAESRDGEDRIEKKVDAIVEHLGIGDKVGASG